MNKYLFLVLIVSLFVPLALSADNSVDYLEGVLEEYNAGRWQELYIGDEIADDARIRLSEEGYAELLVGDSMVSLTRDGVYELEELLRGSSAVSGGGLDLKKKLTLNTSSDKWKHEATMGVRGSEASTSGGTGMEDAFTYLEAGMTSMDAERYDEALINFEEGWEYFEDANCLLFTAICHEILGQKRSYIKSLQDVDGEGLEPEYKGMYIIRMGEVLVRSLDYEGAVDLLGSEKLSNFDNEEQQQILYLMGTAQLGSGSDAAAKNAFRKAVDLAPGSETGRRAAQALSSL